MTALPFAEAHSAVVDVVHTQPSPRTSSGWFITDSDDAGGNVTAQLNGQTCNFFGGCSGYTATVSVTLVERADETGVDISLTNHEESRRLVERIGTRSDVGS